MSHRTRMDARGFLHQVFEFHRVQIVIALVKTHGVVLGEFAGEDADEAETSKSSEEILERSDEESETEGRAEEGFFAKDDDKFNLDNLIKEHSKRGSRRPKKARQMSILV